MSSEILAKLKNLLSRGLHSEQDAVYLMVAVRKLMEIGNLKSTFQTLTFYCDWTVHSKMDRASARNMIRRFDDLYIAREEQTVAEYEVTLSAFEEFASLDRLRHDLGSVFRTYNLDDGLCTDHSAWIKFLSLYGGVISDCPLEYEVSTGFKKIRKVFARRADDDGKGLLLPPGQQLDFSIRWYVITLDGEEMSPIAYHFTK